jgi:hypothetical protein
MSVIIALSDFGRFTMVRSDVLSFTALDRVIDADCIDCFDGSAGIAYRLPARGGAGRQVEGDVETRRAPIVGERDDLQFTGDVRLDVERAHLAVELDGDMARLAEAVLPFHRLGDACGNLLRGDGAARARHHHFGDAAGVDADELVWADRLDHALGRDRAAGAEVGRPEDRHVGHRSRVFNEIADAHDVACDGDAGAQRRHRVLRCGRIGNQGGERQRQCQPSEREGDHDGHPPQRISCAVVCSIWSAAVMTLEFIS